MRLRWVSVLRLGLKVFRVWWFNWILNHIPEPHTWTPIPDLNTSISDPNSKPECQYWMWVFYTYQLTCILKPVYPNLNSEPEYLNVNTWTWLPEYEHWNVSTQTQPEYWAWLPNMSAIPEYWTWIPRLVLSHATTTVHPTLRFPELSSMLKLSCYQSDPVFCL